MSDQLVKVRFKLDAEDWHGHAGEKLWAAKINREEGLFELRNIPSFTRGISYRDVVKASPSEDPMQFDFECVVDRGGHSTYMLLVDPTEKRRGEYWKMLEKAGCSYESGQIELSIGVRLLSPWMCRRRQICMKCMQYSKMGKKREFGYSRKARPTSTTHQANRKPH
ncbi:DUF4265 domain-containing protein [Bradyrhizobium sp. BRP22]|uniref:DUF4265 domain-containing protein n=1 Tax=Bradyrhizobium sp. BRP22 TaxID=2793821 RepID=UPI001CD72F0E|nr:DUF4265 domain-containing protein [Bradyrhizobium sp. BRP22]MCA1452424.1 DUF4265 domain-containing protein [Bradyrhizobium sp. BRP22]